MKKNRAGHCPAAENDPDPRSSAPGPLGGGSHCHPHQLRHPLLPAAGAGLPGGQLILEDDYQLASTSMITVEGLPTHELLAMKQDIDAIPGVLQTFWLSDVVDPAIPVGDAARRCAEIPVWQKRFHHPHRPAGWFQRERGDHGGRGADQKGAAAGLLLWRHQRHFLRYQGAGHPGNAPLLTVWRRCLPAHSVPGVGERHHPLLFMLGLLFPWCTTLAPTSSSRMSASLPRRWPPCCSWA